MRKSWFRTLSLCVLMTFVVNTVTADIAHAGVIEAPHVLMLPPGSLVSRSPNFSLPGLKAIKVNPQDPFKIDFIVDRADQLVTAQEQAEQTQTLTKYFLSFLALPEEDWTPNRKRVNVSYT